MISLQKGKGIESKRRRQTFHATNTGDYVSTSSSQIRIEVNLDKECIDFETSYLMFDFSAAKNGAVDELQTQPWEASSWIRDVRVYDRAGREIGEQIRHYNAFARKQMELLGNDGCNGAENYVGRMEGAQGRTSTNQTSLPAQERAHKFLTHIFDIKSYFPSHLIGGLIVEIDMASTNSVLFLDGTTDTVESYTLSNVRFVTDLVLLKPDAEASLRGQLQNGLEIHYESPMNHNQGIVAANTQQRFDLGIASGKIKYIQAFMVRDTDTAAVNQEAFPSFSQNTLQSYRYKLGSEYLTEKDIQVSATRNVEYVVEYLKSLNLESQDIINFYGDSTLDLDDRFCLGQKVEVSKDPNVSSGRRDYQSNKIELDMVFSSPLTATLYTSTMVEKNLVMLPGRNFRNID